MEISKVMCLIEELRPEPPPTCPISTQTMSKRFDGIEPIKRVFMCFRAGAILT
jgi:hypothetical protein